MLRIEYCLLIFSRTILQKNKTIIDPCNHFLSCLTVNFMRGDPGIIIMIPATGKQVYKQVEV